MADVVEAKNPFLIALGERVRALRARRGLTRKAVAVAADVSERHLANLEYGEGNASILVLLQVAGALQCTLAELIGDVTTTMLWIGGQITALPIMKGLFVPAMVSLLVPLAVVAWQLRGQPVRAPERTDTEGSGGTSAFERQLMFCLGLGILMAVPVFKALTGLPPFMGILLGLGLLWLVGDLVHRHKDDEAKAHLTLVSALQRIDMSAVLFFVGILLAVSTLEHAGLLAALAQWLDLTVGRQDLIVLLIGLVSAVVDNVPLVAAVMGMYSLQQFPADSFLWEFLAYCAGTGGSILIIGSAAGVAAMGLEKIDFFWYVRKVSAWALLGYLAGAATYVLQQKVLG